MELSAPITWLQINYLISACVYTEITVVQCNVVRVVVVDFLTCN